jgi:hypothetical protein
MIYKTRTPVDAECLKEVLREQNPDKNIIQDRPALPKGEAKMYSLITQSIEFKDHESALNFKFGYAILSKNERQKRIELGFTVIKSGDEPITEREKQSAMPEVHELQKRTQDFAKSATERCHLSTDPDDISDDCASFACK